MGRHEPIKTVTLYCAASPNVDQAYMDVAHAFGAGLARSGRALVYGGGGIGLMGAASRGCREHGGRVVGIITTRLRDAEQLVEERRRELEDQTLDLIDDAVTAAEESGQGLEALVPAGTEPATTQ